MTPRRTDGCNEMTDLECAWLAGILEGEGAFFLQTTSCQYPQISLGMTDRDIIERVAVIFKRTVSQQQSKQLCKNGESHKRLYKVRVGGADAVAIMRQIRPWLGARRGAKVDELIAWYEWEELCDCV